MAKTPHPMNPKAMPRPISMGDVSVSNTAPPSCVDVTTGRRVGLRDVTSVVRGGRRVEGEAVRVVVVLSTYFR